MEVLQAFKDARGRLGLEREVTINKTGCTGQHDKTAADQTTIIVYGPNAGLGGVWYRVAAADAEEVLREHIQNGRVVQRLVNPAICICINFQS